jgi:phage tail-like protein
MALTPTIHSNTPTRPDLPFATHFCIEIDGIITAQFQEISGMKMTTQTQDVYEGGNNVHPYKMVGKVQWEPLVLKRGFVAQHTEFYRWMLSIQSSAHYRGTGFRKGKNVQLVAFGETFNPIGRFEFYRAFPIGFSAPDLASAQKGKVAVETITLAYDWFEYKGDHAMAA